MGSNRDVFSISGPSHLTAIDWKNPQHQRSVAAALVQGVYVLELDRQDKRQGTQALAPPWWEFFQFRLFRVLVDNIDSSIFGAIYVLKFPPKYVVAFRGTLFKPGSVSQDLKLDFQFVRCTLQQTPRFQIAMQAVQNILSISGPANVWLAGHSLGSAMALLAGKNMAKRGSPLETFLFNSPYASAPLEWIKDKKLKQGIRFTGSIVKAGLAFARKQNHQQDVLIDLSSTWVPLLFVNPADKFCSEYIGYFEHRKMMEEIGAGCVERLSTQTSFGNLLLGAEDSEPPHLLSSAFLTINLSAAHDFMHAHGIHQWWQPHGQFKSKLFQFS